ncbi:MAG TPA: hypothetical protein VKU41_00250 [Polyangiaceae bacterium]|nr:hypothetical protein [Polyangiaceae bacterium]
MRHGDELHGTLAKHFAWCFARTGADAVAATRLRAAQESAPIRMRHAPDEGPGSGEDLGDAEVDLPAVLVNEVEVERSRDRARDACGPLAAGVRETWAEADEDAAARGTKRLLTRADRLGIELVGMDAYPQEGVRLLRLFVRHGPTMTRRQRERAHTVATLLPLEHPEVAELLVEIARGADRDMADALASGELEEPWTPDVGDPQALAARLAEVIDLGPTHDCRAIAIDVLALLPRCDPAYPALRRALRLPSFAVRARALRALARARPCPVTEDDLASLLRDLVTHGPPDSFQDDRHEEDERTLAEAVVAALAHVRPPEAEETLLDLIDADFDAVWLDAGWATEALAVAFPETAATMVDHWLTCARGYERMRALAAMQRLPDEIAAPRLMRAATDPSLAVREGARRHWLERFDRSCPVGPMDVVGAELLAAPPSDRFVARLAVLQGRLREARAAMARALLAEAPDREALVLLLQVVADEGESGEPGPGSRNPSLAPSDGWAATLARRFGAAGVEGLCAVAARFREPESFGWMRRLGDLVERGIIGREHVAPLRALAAAHVASADAGRVDDSLRLLALVGPPSEILDRVLVLALDDDLGSSEARALVVSWTDRVVDTRLTSEMVLALAEQDWTRLRYAAWLALERGAPAARVIAQRVLEVAEREPDAVDAAVECARYLWASGHLDDTWAFAALARPESPIFAVAAQACRHHGDSVRAALEAALGSTARGGASAVQAAVALLHADPAISPRDRRLAGVLDTATTCERAELVYAMCVRGAPLGVVAPHLEELFASSDPGVTGALVGLALWLKSPKARALLRGVLPRVVDVELRADIEEALGSSPAPFWADR